MKVKHLLGILTVLLASAISVGLFLYFDGSPKNTKINPHFLYLIGATGSSKLSEPSYALPVNNRLYVADSGSGSVKVFDLEGHFKFSFDQIGAGKKLGYPFGLALLGNNNLLVSDSKRQAVYEFSQKGRFVRQWAIDGKLAPGYMTTGPDEEIYICDLAGRRILVFDSDGRPVRSLKPAGVTLDGPQGIAVSDRQTVTVGDNANFNVKVLGADGQVKLLFDGGPQAALTTVKGVARDAAGRIYVVEALANVVRVFDANGNEITRFGGKGSRPGEFVFPTGISMDGSGRVFIADQGNNRIQVWKM